MIGEVQGSILMSALQMEKNSVVPSPLADSGRENKLQMESSDLQLSLIQSEDQAIAPLKSGLKVKKSEKVASVSNRSEYVIIEPQVNYKILVHMRFLVIMVGFVLFCLQSLHHMKKCLKFDGLSNELHWSV